MEQILAIVRVNGRVPRRAVLIDGALGDRVSRPEAPEVDLLSRVCEIARQAMGVPCYPRRTFDVLDLALSGNAAGAWEALKDDLLTGDFNDAEALAVLRQGSNAASLVGCMVGARDSPHVVHIACVMSRLMDSLDEETRRELGKALACQLRAVMDSFVRHGALMSRDVRDAVLDGFGVLLERVDLDLARVADAVLYALGCKRDELLRLFLGYPGGMVTHRPAILPALLDRLTAAQSQARYPLVALLARILEAAPEVVTGHEVQLTDIVCSCMNDPELDARLCLALAGMVIATGGCGSPMALALGKGLGTCAGALVRRIKNV